MTRRGAVAHRLFQETIIAPLLVLGIGIVIVAMSSAAPAQEATSTAPKLQVSPVAPNLPFINVQLFDASGKPYIPNGSVPVSVDFAGAVKGQRTLTLSPDQPIATLELPEPTAGAVHFNASDSQNPGRFLSSSAAYSFSGATSVPGPLRIELQVDSPFLLVGQTAKLIASLVTGKETPALAPVDLDINFPQLQGALSPPMIEIPRNKQFGVAELTSKSPGRITLRPFVQPLDYRGNPIAAPPKVVEFVMPAAQVRVEPVQSYLVSSLFKTPSQEITVELFDSRGNPVNSQGVREIFLTVDPPAGGRIAQSKLQIEPGTESAITKYTPSQGGTTNIVASAGGLGTAKASVTFDYPFYGGEMLWLVLVGGVVGAFLKAMEQTKLQKKSVSFSDFGKKFLWTGILGAVLAFLFGGSLLRTEFQQALSLSRPLVSIYWGMFGGYFGPLFIVGSLTPKHDAA